MNPSLDTDKSSLLMPVLLGVLVAMVMGVALGKEFGYIEPFFAKQMVGVLFGVLLIVSGNAIPKLVRPLSVLRQSPAKVLAAERFAGRIFVLGGILFAGAFIFAPQEHAMLVASLIGLGAFLLAGLNWLRLTRGLGSDIDQDILEDESVTLVEQKRWAVAQILYALVWVFAIFLADSIWGDATAKWMALIFVLTLGFMSAYRSKKKKSED